MKKMTAVLTLLVLSALFLSFNANAKDFVALRALVETHPDWPTVTNEDLVIWLNDETIQYRPTNASSRGIWDVIISYDDFDVLGAADRELVTTTLFGGWNNEVDISTNLTPTSVMLIRVFTGTPTLPALNNSFTHIQSPCDSIAWPGECLPGDVEYVRTF